VDVSSIITPVRTELAAFEAHFREAMRSNVGLVDTVVRYVVRRKGKRVRPALVLLSAQATGGISERTYRGAALVELLHTATLVHDDVVDDAEKRRGLASINAVWKNKVAVLMGDYILARGLLLSLSGRDYDLLHSSSEAVRRMSEGELLQIQKSRQMNTDEETYYRIIGDKTASLLAACCEIGARSATDDETVITRMRDYGENIGMAFQIRDDLLDYLSTERTLGKPIGGDLKEKKLTLPLIHALRTAKRSAGRRVLRLLRNGVGRREINEIVSFVEAHGGTAYARTRADHYRDAALACLADLPASDAVASLRSFAQYVISRTK
jgi:octaprenyl-diphosphate synthase